MLVSLFSLWRTDSEGERIVITSIVYLPHPTTLSGSLPLHVLFNLLQSPHRPLSQLLLRNDHNSVLKPLPSNTDISDTSDVSLFVVCVVQCALEEIVNPLKVEVNFRTIEETNNFLQQGTGMKIIYFETGNMTKH